MNKMTSEAQMQRTSSVAWAAPIRIGKVTLVVRDLAKVSEFYQQVIGLKVLSADEKAVLLGSGSTALIELKHEPKAEIRSRREAGLFHTAFLLPSRAHLASWINHVAANRMPVQGASDHLASEAIYLADPEGNGIEVYADKLPSEWREANGSIKMATEHLDIEGLVAAGDAGSWQEAPDGTFIGHIHLKVGDLAKSEEFYGKILGFDLVSRYPGANFFSTGKYHHHIGANTWNSRGAAVHTSGTTGLESFDLVATTQEAYTEVMQRLESAGLNGPTINDPWGTTVHLVKA